MRGQHKEHRRYHPYAADCCTANVRAHPLARLMLLQRYHTPVAAAAAAFIHHCWAVGVLYTNSISEPADHNKLAPSVTAGLMRDFLHSYDSVEAPSSVTPAPMRYFLYPLSLS